MKPARTPFADRVFGWLLRAFPSEFRGDFGEAMSEDFKDQREDAYGTKGLPGLAWLWSRTVIDLLRRAPREQADVLATDFRFALRMMRRYGVSTAVIVLMLAGGIGYNIAVFQLADLMVNQPMPVADGRSLVRIVSAPSGDALFSFPEYNDFQQRGRVFIGVIAHQYTTVALGSGEEARPLGGEVVSGNYFEVLGVRPALGRLIQPADDVEAGGHAVVVISDALWRSYFGGAADVIGRTIKLNGHALEVIGVAPSDFPGSYTAFATRFWAPLSTYRQVRPQNLDLNRRGWSWLGVTARVAPGVEPALVESDLARLAAELDRELPAGEKRRFTALPASGLPEGMRRSAGQVLMFAAVIAGLVLLVTCANIAGVLQSRALARQHETSIRYALGASRVRVLRQSLTESLCLALLGGAAGLFVARWMEGGLSELVRTAVPMELSSFASLDLRVLAFTIVMVAVAGLLFGLFPAWRSASRGEVALREGSATLAGGGRAGRSVRALAAIQVAVCLCLLVTGGLLTQSLRNARTFDPGFDASSLVVAKLDFRRYGYDRARGMGLTDSVLSRLRVRPDVRAASISIVVPLGGDQERLGFIIPGHTLPSGKRVIPIDVNGVGSDYFRTMGIPIIAGRGIEPTDDERSRPVAVVNETMARRYWPGGDAVGQRFALAGGAETPLEVVGVVRDIKYYSLDESARSYVYLSVLQAPAAAPVVHVRVNGDTNRFVGQLKREVASADPNIVVDQAMTFEELRQQPLALRRAMTVVANLFSGIALVLAIVGIYGTMSNAVGQRTREIGVRMAFGARAGDVYRMILVDGLVPVAGGIAAGLMAAGLVTRVVAAELFGVTPRDPKTHVLAAVAVVLASVAALSFPARRATRVDPVAILRE